MSVKKELQKVKENKEDYLKTRTYTCDYLGDVDKDGKACGFGVATATNANGYVVKFEGTWLDDQPHGVVKVDVEDSISVGEWCQGSPFGRGSFHSRQCTTQIHFLDK